MYVAVSPRYGKFLLWTRCPTSSNLHTAHCLPRKSKLKAFPQIQLVLRARKDNCFLFLLSLPPLVRFRSLTSVGGSSYGNERASGHEILLLTAPILFPRIALYSLSSYRTLHSLKSTCSRTYAFDLPHQTQADRMKAGYGSSLGVPLNKTPFAMTSIQIFMQYTSCQI